MQKPIEATPFAVYHQTGGRHPLLRTPGWDLLSIRTASAPEFIAAIEQAEAEHWVVWGRQDALRYASLCRPTQKPEGAQHAV